MSAATKTPKLKIYVTQSDFSLPVINREHREAVGITDGTQGIFFVVATTRVEAAEMLAERGYHFRPTQLGVANDRYIFARSLRASASQLYKTVFFTDMNSKIAGRISIDGTAERVGEREEQLYLIRG